MGLPVIGAVLAVAGTAVGTMGQISQANYQAQIARNNAQIEKQNAAYAASAGAAQTEQSGLAERERLGQLRAGVAANGLDVNSGTPADLQVSQREIGNLNTRTVSNNAALQAYGYQSKATSYEAQAAMDKSEIGYDIAGGILKAGGQIAGSPSASNALGFGSSGADASLISGNPSVPSNYQWMQAPDDTGQYLG